MQKRFTRAVDLDALLKDATQAIKAANLSSEEKRGAKVVMRCIVEAAGSSCYAHNLEYAFIANGECSHCGATVGRTDKWCASCGALLDGALQRSIADMGIKYHLQFNQMLEKLK